MTQVWVLVGSIDYADDTVVGVYSTEEAAAAAGGEWWTTEAKRKVYDEYRVIGPVEVDAPARQWEDRGS